MIDERKEEAASLYAFDLLEGAEKTAFEAELERDPMLRKLVDELRQTSTGLALTAPPRAPSPQLKAKVLASIEAAGKPNNSSRIIKADTAVQPASSRKAEGNVIPFSPLPWGGWGLAACFAILAGYFSLKYVEARSQATLQSQAAQLADLEMRSLKQTLEAERIVARQQIADLKRASDFDQLKIAKLASLLENSREAVAIAVWNPLRQEGVLTVDNLPRIQQDQSYQLWVIDPAEPGGPVSGGVFSVDDRGTARLNFRPDQPVNAAKQFAISRERKGGAPKPEGKIVAAGAL